MKKLRGTYSQVFRHNGMEYIAHVREYATFWEGETSVADYFKVYKDKNKRAVTRGITAWIFVQKHFMPIFDKTHKHR